ncbi:CRISPR-associated protein Cas5 family, partial [mine drainage metagenome]
PGFTLYLGRKACPLALPLQPTVVQAEHVEGALAGVSMGDVLKHLAEAEGREESLLARHFSLTAPLLLWDSDAKTRQTPEQTVTRRDAPLSRCRWQFKVRDEHRAQLAKEDQP